MYARSVLIDFLCTIAKSFFYVGQECLMDSLVQVCGFCGSWDAVFYAKDSGALAINLRIGLACRQVERSSRAGLMTSQAYIARRCSLVVVRT